MPMQIKEVVSRHHSFNLFHIERFFVIKKYVPRQGTKITRYPFEQEMCFKNAVLLSDSI